VVFVVPFVGVAVEMTLLVICETIYMIFVVEVSIEIFVADVVVTSVVGI